MIRAPAPCYSPVLGLLLDSMPTSCNLVLFPPRYWAKETRSTPYIVTFVVPLKSVGA